MQTYRVRHRDRTTLFEGDYRSYRECIETACAEGISLAGADLSQSDLSEINLDGVALTGVDFSFSNLTGANLSEAVLRDCVFENTSLYNTCFCASQLTNCNFVDAMFGGTDISGASLEHCRFSGRSSLALGWAGCASMAGSSYATLTRSCAMSSPPLVIQGEIAGLPDTLIGLFDEDLLINQALFSFRSNVWLPDPATLPHAANIPAQLHKALFQLQSLRCKRLSGLHTKSTKS